ncbi:hypothetical protein B0T20DRAFT_414798 [Sordaria brevicollis]|uniref:BZIP domain-containing protein n=1 Tax=Sordaria brevicollis TaxID=83679 RepID=A0AAE0UAZ4_SORBR|nr:hypothetical protein B0T20DRAFT_414798 [Sordaria brevicollis]
MNVTTSANKTVNPSELFLDTNQPGSAWDQSPYHSDLLLAGLGFDTTTNSFAIGQHANNLNIPFNNSALENTKRLTANFPTQPSLVTQSQVLESQPTGNGPTYLDSIQHSGPNFDFDWAAGDSSINSINFTIPTPFTIPQQPVNGWNTPASATTTPIAPRPHRIPGPGSGPGRNFGPTNRQPSNQLSQKDKYLSITHRQTDQYHRVDKRSRIQQLVNNMKTMPVIVEDRPCEFPKLSKRGKHRDEDDLDEDERVLKGEEAKGMTSAQRRQLRNKVSARNFRARKKDYINDLEEKCKEQHRTILQLEANMRAQIQDNENCKALIVELLGLPEMANVLGQYEKKISAMSQTIAPAQINMDSSSIAGSVGMASSSTSQSQSMFTTSTWAQQLGEDSNDVDDFNDEIGIDPAGLNFPR